MNLKIVMAEAAVLTLWVGLFALAYLVVRELGWARVKQHVAVVIALSVALVAMPIAAVAGAIWSIHGQIMYRLQGFWYKSPMIIMSKDCSMLPADNIWNTKISGMPVAARSQSYIESIGKDLPLRGDFGPRAGIPYIVVDGSAPMTEIAFEESEESDPGPYRIPMNAPIEDGGDGHVLAVDRESCHLYELFAANRDGNRWKAGSGANFDLRSNALRTPDYTSADAAGLPILPGLIRYQEVTDGEIKHALRFTARKTQRAFVWPARHRASASTDPNLPPMGQRFRLRHDFDISGYSLETQVILTALKNYGMMLSDNGRDWFMTGATDSRWKKQTLQELATVKGKDMEAVDVSALMVDPNSGQARY